jgi:hypothetical protein
MRTRDISIAVLLLLVTATGAPAAPTVRIFDDPGGQIGVYLAKYHALRVAGERVEIDGLCASACTLVVGILPRSRICVTERAVLEFHRAWVPGTDGSHITSGAGNSILWSNYPADLRDWIARRGGLGPQILDLRGPELAAMFSRCR